MRRTRALKPIQTTKNVENILSCTEVGQPLSPMARKFHEPESNVYIIIVIGFQTQINPEVVKANLVDTFLKQPRFSCLQVADEKNGGQLKWVRTEVDLDNHVKVPSPDLNQVESADMYVEDYVSNLSRTKISMSIPMWDLHLLNIRTSKAESVGILRVHHSIGDGVSLMSLFLSCSRKVSDPDALPTLPASKKQKPCSTSSGGFLQHFIRLFSVLLIYWNTLVDVVMFLITILFLDDTKTPLKGPSGVGSTPRRIVHRIVSLDDVKLVKNAMNATINDVMVGVTQAALSRYLNRKYAGKNKKGGGGAAGNNNLPKNIRLRATSFVNLRPYLGNEDTAETMKSISDVKLGNLIGYVLFPFTIALREDALDYVRSAKATGKRKKATLEAIYTYFMAKTFNKFFGTKWGSFPTQTTLWFSNVPGPQEEITCFGHQVAYIAPTCYGQPNALMIHVVSYANKINIILSVDEGIVPDPHQLCDDLEESLRLIKDVVIYKGLVDCNVY